MSGMRKVSVWGTECTALVSHSMWLIRMRFWFAHMRLRMMKQMPETFSYSYTSFPPLNFCFLIDAVQEKLNSWLLKTQRFLNEVTSPLVRTSPTGKLVTKDAFETQDMDDIFMAEQTINSKTPNGILSLAAIVSVEQFSRWD